MPNKHGDFIWYELMTNDADGAQTFYRNILGWTFTDSGQPEMDYRTFAAGDESVGGVMSLTSEMTANGARPCWMGYINVTDVDASAEAIKAAGGTIHFEPRDIPGVGRFAFVSDPQGVMFYIMKPTPPAESPDATSKAFAYDEPMIGHCAWNELMTTDQDAAVAFYTEQFGWQQKDAMDMGPMGQYKFFHHGEKMLGAVMTKPEEVPVAFWTYYFRIADIDKAAEKITSSGGTLLMEPQEIPGDEFMINAVDPQGAHFALVGPRNPPSK
jgi:predicted enzyme related to lactoylglutathione lyase